MARTKQTARKCLVQAAPRKQIDKRKSSGGRGGRGGKRGKVERGNNLSNLHDS